MIQPGEWPDLSRRMAEGDPEAHARVVDACAKIIPLLRRVTPPCDPRALDALVDLHRPWIEREAARLDWVCKETGLDRRAVIQEGAIGLRGALSLYEAARLEKNGSPNPAAFGAYIEHVRAGIRRPMDTLCLQELSTACAGQIRAIAKLYVRAHPGCGLDDLCQEGFFALRKAFYGFRPELGFKFSTYLSPKARAVMERVNREGVGISEETRKYRSLVRRAQNVLPTHWHEPTAEEIVAWLRQEGHDEVSGERVIEILRATSPTVSMGAVRENEEGGNAGSLEQQISDPRPGPEAIAEREDLLARLSRDQARVAALWILLEVGLEWDRIAGCLQKADHLEMCRKWPPDLDWHAWPGALPRDWAGVCALFATPPPKLTVGNLKTWYSRQLREPPKDVA